MTLSQLLFSLAMYALGVIFFGLALTPSVFIFLKIWALSSGESLLSRSLAAGFALGFGYFVFGFGLIVLSGMVRSFLAKT